MFWENEILWIGDRFGLSDPGHELTASINCLNPLFPQLPECQHQDFQGSKILHRLQLERFSLFCLILTGVVARHPVYLPYLRQALTAEAVESYFAHLFENTNGTNVERY